jgi:hypothetical protein
MVMRLKIVMGVAAALIAFSACKGSVTGQTSGSGGGATSTPSTVNPSSVVERVVLGGVDKIDVVLDVDNSTSMADKQAILALAIPDLILGLVNPPCIDDMTNLPIPAALQPAEPGQTCPTGSSRAFPLIQDIHIGMISSSLGTFGADGCKDIPPLLCPTANTTSNDDHGHLVTRTDPCSNGPSVPTYNNSGFLAWDPASKLSPPGETMVGGIGMGGLVGRLHDLVVGDGQLGCGFESQNEAWYRFLVDPTPYQSISLDSNNQVQVSGTDNTLLSQRADFLRPDSLLAIVVVTDETDVSIKHYSSYPLYGAPEVHLPHPRRECSTKGPTDPCCASCGQPTPTGCPTDPMCVSSPSYSATDENTSLRSFGLISHKQRYGIEFMYQPSRYVSALTSAKVSDVNGKMVDNPIYSNLKPSVYKGTVRDPGLVFYAAIVGVPWQLIARQDAAGIPDLLNGINTLDPTGPVGGFKSAKELSQLDPKGNIIWDDIAGDPENYVYAKSPFMVEATAPRSGIDPITGAAIAPTTTPNQMGSRSGGALLNDHERTLRNPPDDIEYACIFDLPAGRDCTTAGTSCDCPNLTGVTTDNPLCDNTNPTQQIRAKAYPGTKHLAIARGLADQGIVASICPKQLTDLTSPDYGYRPAVRAIIDRLEQALHGQCLPRQLTPNAQGQVSCLILEATSTGGACDCSAIKGRQPVSSAHEPAVLSAQQDPLAATAHWDCFCEIPQVQPPSGAVVSDCQTSATPISNGWCYVDPSAVPPNAPAGTQDQEAALVAGCPVAERHNLRFVGNGAPQPGATLFISCTGQ